MVSMGYHEGVDCKFFRAGMRRHFAPMLWECKDRLNQCIDVKISVAVKWPNHREGRELSIIDISPPIPMHCDIPQVHVDSSR